MHPMVLHHVRQGYTLQLNLADYTNTVLTNISVKVLMKMPATYFGIISH